MFHDNNPLKDHILTLIHLKMSQDQNWNLTSSHFITNKTHHNNFFDQDLPSPG